MNLYKISTIGLLTGIVVACGAAGTDATPVARADDGTAGAAPDCMCTGQPGPQGVPGPSGPPGLQGPAGKDAVCANDMNSCPPGVPGPQGPTGAVGPAGPQGPKGDPGLNGSDGMTGPAGASGPAGAKGEKGDTGTPGPAGSQGPAGKDGKDGTVITKENIYVRSAMDASNGIATAYCDDADDVIISGGCFTNGTLHVVGATGPSGLTSAASVDGKSGWICGTATSPTPGAPSVTATATCLAVP